jgi:hypothetical protein
LLSALLLFVVLFAPLPVEAQSEACELSLSPPDFPSAPEDELHALPHGRSAGHVAFHGQGLYGLDNLYLIHLAVFMGDPENHPHNFQVILEADLDDADARNQYRAHRSAEPFSLYTATPPRFDQTALVAGYPGRPALASLPASRACGTPSGSCTSIVKGHFEQGGQPVVENVDFSIARVVYFREFHLGGERLGAQNYVLFGRGGEAFAAHLLSAPPDFDQVLAVEVAVADSGDATSAAALGEALAGGFYMRLPERQNDEASRLAPGGELACSLRLPEATAPIAVTVRTGDEIYCEAGEFSALVIGAFNTPRRCAPR